MLIVGNRITWMRNDQSRLRIYINHISKHLGHLHIFTSKQCTISDRSFCLLQLTHGNIDTVGHEKTIYMWNAQLAFSVNSCNSLSINCIIPSHITQHNSCCRFLQIETDTSDAFDCTHDTNRIIILK